MKIFKKITNGIIIIIIGCLHTQLAFSPDGFGKYFYNFSKSYFFKVSNGIYELPPAPGKTNPEAAAAFWFFYFGILLIPLGMLLHSVEKEKGRVPGAFAAAYLIVVLIGCYMIPASGMTIFMLPHAVFMLVYNVFRAGKISAANRKSE